ncbi:17581_t:CDS:2, partial [Gigaspora rosea]
PNVIKMSQSLKIDELSIEESINDIFNDLLSYAKELGIGKHDRVVKEYCVEEYEKNNELTIMLQFLFCFQRSFPGHTKNNTYKNKFPSTREHLWSYSYDPKVKFVIPPELGLLEKTFEQIEEHTAKLCLVPLPGLCTRPQNSKNSMFDFLFPYKQSPFVKFVLYNPVDYNISSKTSITLFSSPPLQAIVKFKWHILRDKRAMIATMVLGGIIILLMIRSFITLVLMGLEANEDSHKNSHKNRNFIRYFLSPVSYLLAIGLCLPFITAFLEFYKYFGYDMDLVPSFLYDVVLFISAQTSMTFLKYTETDDSDESLIINKTNKTDSQVLYSIYKTDDKNGNYKKENTFDSFVAVVTKTYEEVLLDSYTQWTIVRAYIIALMETIFVIDSECLPYTIAYEAFNEEVEKYYNEKFEKRGQ